MYKYFGLDLIESVYTMGTENQSNQFIIVVFFLFSFRFCLVLGFFGSIIAICIGLDWT